MTKEKDDDKTDEARMFKEESGKGSFTPPPFPTPLTSLSFKWQSQYRLGETVNSNDTPNHIEESFSLAVPREG